MSAKSCIKNNKEYLKKMSQYDNDNNFIGYRGGIEINDLYKGDTIVDKEKQATKKRRRLEKDANKKMYREAKIKN